MSQRLYMLDTNVVSYILKLKSRSAFDRLANLTRDEKACVSCVTEAELWYGLHRSHAGQKQRLHLEEFLLNVVPLPWRSQEAHAFGLIRAQQEAAGHTLAPFDMMIAAHAISVGAILVSSDRAFRYVTGLPGLENWATDLIAGG
ncbi:type II toxin-antitoxin system VapC family toxin [Occallatibacter riparius]|uniref:Type II toxin-antitoxin system VapC family toxin n=1 Tax=Occallatibacter riparius TaxID=1002689 RepID=A0A9J7BK76_9BACT|nr:type II toxin-antitoxin system VapC family toxin [Occallatibacter riparius]UWZ82971.1 type II toxin-antitoxin system VapC family toxin [Occallatibacter riparius]